MYAEYVVILQLQFIAQLLFMHNSLHFFYNSCVSCATIIFEQICCLKLVASFNMTAEKESSEISGGKIYTS